VPIYDLSSRYLNSSDQMIEMFYDLLSANYDRLAPIDGPQELVFSLGRVFKTLCQPISFHKLM